MLRDKDRIFIPPILTLVSFLLLFIFRSYDDNRLTSWYWIFTHVDPVKVYFALTAASVFVMVLIWFVRWRGIFGYSSASFPVQENRLRYWRVVYADSLCAAVILIGYFLAGILFWTIPEINIDAARYFTQAKHLELFGVGYFLAEWGREIHAWTDMPLMPFFYGIIFRFFGEARTYIQLFTTALFALTGLLTYKTGKLLWDAETGIYGAVFLLCIPYLFTQVPLMLVDVPTMFFLMLSIYTFIRAIEYGGLWIIFASLSIFFTFLSKYSAGLMLSVLPVVVFVYLLKSGKAEKKSCFARAAVTALAAGLFIGLFVFYEYDVVKDQIRLLMSYQKPALKRWEESLCSTFLFQTHPFLTALAVVSVYAAVKRKDWTYLIIAWLVLLAVFLQIRRMRYIIMLFPLLALMASYGLKSVKGIENRIITVSCALISSLVLAVTAYLPFLQELSMVNLEKAAEFLDTRSSSAVEVQVVQPANLSGSLLVAVPIMDLFSRRTLVVDDRFPVRLNSYETGLSPLRFTWEFRNPSYYRTAETTTYIDTVAVISDSGDSPLPAYLLERLSGFQLVKSFAVYEGIFSFRTSVRIYEKSDDKRERTQRFNIRNNYRFIGQL